MKKDTINEVKTHATDYIINKRLVQENQPDKSVRKRQIT